MTDDWQIASLSQTIEEEEDDDALVPPTPGQEDVDMATPSQDSASLLSAMTESQGIGRRKPHTLSLGLPEDPESEGLPFLALEWDSQFPSTPAQENGQSPDNNNFLKGKDDGEDEKEDRLGSENFNGQSASHHGCYSLENDKEAGVSGFTRGSNGEESNTKDQSKKEDKKLEEAGDNSGGGSQEGYSGEGGGGGDGGGGGEGGGDGGGNDDKNGKEAKEEDEESSHEPSSDSSEGLQTTSAGEEKSKHEDPEEMEIDVATGGVEIGCSQGDMFASQEVASQKVAQPREVSGMTLTPATSMPILQLSQGEEEEEEEVPPPPGKFLSGTPSASLALGSSQSATSTSPTKRKRAELEDPLSETEHSEIPLKQRRMEEASSDSGEDRVIVDYRTLTRKDVEISPKQQKPPPRVVKPTHLLAAAKRITFSSEDLQTCTEREDPLRQLPVDTEEEESEHEKDLPVRQPVDTEAESSDSQKVSDDTKKGDTASKAISDSECEDSDIEILEDKDRSIEVLYEKSKGKSSLEQEIGSQDFSLMLSGAEHESQYPQAGQRFSEGHILTEEGESQSQSLLSMTESEHLQCHDTMSSSSSESSQHAPETLVGSMPATQLEGICQPVVLSQPNIDPLISLPISSAREKEKDSDSSGEISPKEKDTEEEGSKEKSESQKKVDEESEMASSMDISQKVETARLKMPEIFTPPSQDYEVTEESESVFTKATKVAQERSEKEKKRMEEDKQNQETLEKMTSSGSPSFESLGTSPIEEGPIKVTEKSIIECSMTGSSNQSTPVSSLQPTRSSHSTPVTSQPQRKLSQSATLFGSANKESTLSSSQLSGSQQVLAEETDSEDEGQLKRKRKKHRPTAESEQPGKTALRASNIKAESRKTSTPNTSQGVSLNISGDGSSYIDKEQAGILSGVETSKSHNTSSEQSGVVKSPDQSTSPGRRASTPDTELLPDVERIHSVEELQRAGFKINRQLDPAEVIEYIHPVTRDTIYVTIVHDVGDLEAITISKLHFKPASESGSGSGGSRSSRISDVSSISRTTYSSSGYYGDKSSSSSNSSRRTSMFSTAESSRLSVGSVVTLSSPPKEIQIIAEHSKKDLASQKAQDDGLFRVPAAHPRAQAGVKLPDTSQKVTEQILQIPVPQRLAAQKALAATKKSPPSSSSSSTDSKMPSADKPRRGRGRGRGSRDTGRGGSSGSSSGPRGRGRGRGRGRVPITKSSTETEEEDHEYDEESPDFVDALPSGGKSSGNSKSDADSGASSASVTKTARGLGAISELLSSLPEDIWKVLENSQVPLSEEEEEAFVRLGGTEAEERQLAQVLKRVREAELDKGLLVFARFTDNNFYSAVLHERDGADRWHVQFTLDQYTASVRDVYLLPTDLLPRGHHCFVRHQTEHYSDPGVVKGHIRVGSTLLHIVETDRGVTQRVPHSHLLLTGPQAHDLLQARLNFRSMVASPGRDVSLDNIVMGRRRRTTQDQFSSPRSKKADENLDTSDATAGESEDMNINIGRSPIKRGLSARGRRGAKRRNLSVLPEESESEAEVTPGPDSKRGGRRAGTPKVVQTPRTPKTPHASALSEELPEKKDLLTDAEKEPLPPKISLLQVQEPILSTPPKKRGRPAGQSSGTQTPKKLLRIDEEIPPDPRLGPLPPESSQIFAGYTILLTSGDSSIKKRQNADDEGLPTFDKDYLTKQFTRGGGRVLEKYAEAEIILAEQGRSSVGRQVTPKAKKKSGTTLTTLLLISNTYCRTAKYIQCLAAGIPIVSFQWVIASCAQNKDISWRSFLLPAGEKYSGELSEQMIRLEEDSQTGPLQLLTGERIFLATSSNPEFSPLWQPLLDTTGAKVRVKPARNGNLNRVLDKSIKVVVADPTIPDAEKQRAEQLSIPVVSTEWVIQSLIAGKRISYGAYPSFRYDFRDTATPSKLDKK
ncbi:TP53-binding protein 1-like isoform X2 [Penaeus chinensis]|uniref:TP53-binding protein 1-like isoform X2 n=1 Tax=Penaeus chinensis TaxID=139456 RepID=UPI001FB61163|nr:TP53-binding protein 1-like isoform X2 [Penaeus chinensis]